MRDGAPLLRGQCVERATGSIAPQATLLSVPTSPRVTAMACVCGLVTPTPPHQRRLQRATTRHTLPSGTWYRAPRLYLSASQPVAAPAFPRDPLLPLPSHPHPAQRSCAAVRPRLLVRVAVGILSEVC